MMHVGTDVFLGQVKAFSNNIGKIQSYEYVNDDSVSVILRTEKSTFSLAGKTSFIGNFSCVLGWYDDDEVSPDELKQINEAVKKTKTKWSNEKNDWVPYDYGDRTLYIIDPRPVRACLLGNYKAFHDGDHVDKKGIAALLNASVDWTIDDAREWLVRNGFPAHDSLAEIDYSRERNNPYMIDKTPMPALTWAPCSK